MHKWDKHMVVNVFLSGLLLPKEEPNTAQAASTSLLHKYPRGICMFTVCI